MVVLELQEGITEGQVVVVMEAVEVGQVQLELITLPPQEVQEVQEQP